MGLLANDKVQLTWKGLCFGQRIILTHTLQVASDFPVINSVKADLDLIINAVTVGGVNNITTPYRACLPPDYSLTDLVAQRILPTRSAYTSLGFIGAAGTWATAATVANDSACLTLRTDRSGRSQVANKHIGPAPDDASVAGLLTAAYKAVLTALGNTLIVSFTPAGGALVFPIILHRATGTADVVTGFVLGQQSRVQRRRTVGVGE